VFAWHCAEIAVMGAAGAVQILYGRELKGIEDAEARTARQKELVAEYERAFSNPYAAAASDQVTDIINPAESRARIALTLRTLLSKREQHPAKKHGNMPL
jgi:propionyl-CoA carboxylase beta chain